MSRLSRLTEDKLPEALPEHDKARLLQIADDLSEDTTEENKGRHKVTEELCGIMTDMYEQDMSLRDILELVPLESSSTVYTHVSGKCKHSKRSRITYDECGWMRYHASKGAPSSTLAMLYDTAQQVAVRHIAGHCNHSHGLSPVTGHDLKNNSRPDPATDTTVCACCGEEFEHRACQDRVTCSYECRGKYARGKRTENVASGD